MPNENNKEAQPLPVDLVAVRHAADLLDRAFTIPVVGVKVGWDPILGLVPGGGDAVTAMMGASVLVAGIRHRVPAPVLVRIALNVLADMTVGTVPLVGDLLDVAWKSNVRNVELVLRHRDTTRPPREVPWFVKTLVYGVAVTLGACAVGVGVLLYLVVKAAWLSLS